MAELDECFPDTKHTEREMSLLEQLQKAESERDTARAEADQYYAAGLRQGEALDTLQAKVARAVAALAANQNIHTWQTGITAALAALR